MASGGPSDASSGVSPSSLQGENGSHSGVVDLTLDDDDDADVSLAEQSANLTPRALPNDRSEKKDENMPASLLPADPNPANFLASFLGKNVKKGASLSAFCQHRAIHSTPVQSTSTSNPSEINNTEATSKKRRLPESDDSVLILNIDPDDLEPETSDSTDIRDGTSQADKSSSRRENPNLSQIGNGIISSGGSRALIAAIDQSAKRLKLDATDTPVPVTQRASSVGVSKSLDNDPGFASQVLARKQRDVPGLPVPNSATKSPRRAEWPEAAHAVNQLRTGHIGRGDSLREVQGHSSRGFPTQDHAARRPPPGAINRGTQHSQRQADHISISSTAISERSTGAFDDNRTKRPVKREAGDTSSQAVRTAEPPQPRHADHRDAGTQQQDTTAAVVDDQHEHQPSTRASEPKKGTWLPRWAIPGPTPTPSPEPEPKPKPKRLRNGKRTAKNRIAGAAPQPLGQYRSQPRKDAHHQQGHGPGRKMLSSKNRLERSRRAQRTRSPEGPMRPSNEPAHSAGHVPFQSGGFDMGVDNRLSRHGASREAPRRLDVDVVSDQALGDHRMPQSDTLPAPGMSVLETTNMFHAPPSREELEGARAHMAALMKQQPPKKTVAVANAYDLPSDFIMARPSYQTPANLTRDVRTRAHNEYEAFKRMIARNEARIERQVEGDPNMAKQVAKVIKEKKKAFLEMKLAQHIKERDKDAPNELTVEFLEAGQGGNPDDEDSARNDGKVLISEALKKDDIITVYTVYLTKPIKGSKDSRSKLMRTKGFGKLDSANQYARLLLESKTPRKSKHTSSQIKSLYFEQTKAGLLRGVLKRADDMVIHVQVCKEMQFVGSLDPDVLRGRWVEEELIKEREKHYEVMHYRVKLKSHIAAEDARAAWELHQQQQQAAKSAPASLRGLEGDELLLALQAIPGSASATRDAAVDPDAQSGAEADGDEKDDLFSLNGSVVDSDKDQACEMATSASAAGKTFAEPGPGDRSRSSTPANLDQLDQEVRCSPISLCITSDLKTANLRAMAAVRNAWKPEVADMTSVYYWTDHKLPELVEEFSELDLDSDLAEFEFEVPPFHGPDNRRPWKFVHAWIEVKEVEVEGPFDSNIDFVVDRRADNFVAPEVIFQRAAARAGLNADAANMDNEAEDEEMAEEDDVEQGEPEAPDDIDDKFSEEE